MPDALPLTGLYGKVPAHGDFVRRGLPTSFVGPWDTWLQDGMATGRDRLGDRWAALWDGAPPWRFALPAGACGPDAVAGVLLPSEDMVGRRFPITLAAILAPGDRLPGPGWFAALEAAALAGRAGQADADALAAAIPHPAATFPDASGVLTPATWPLAEPADPPPPGVATTDLLDIFSSAPTAAISEAPRTDDEPDLADDGAMATAPLPVAEPDPFGTAQADDAGMHGQTPADGQDLLDFFSDAQPPGSASASAGDALDPEGGPAPRPSMATPPAPEPMPTDGTLAFLLGEGSAPAVEASRSASASEDVSVLMLGGVSEAPAEAADQVDPLAALIAAGDAPLSAAPPEGDGPAMAVPMPMDLPAAPMPDQLPAAEAPAPPPDGGWWTHGGGRLPAATRPLPALPPASDFASFLGADA
jgi:type VI secretion system protein ImpM